MNTDKTPRGSKRRFALILPALLIACALHAQEDAGTDPDLDRFIELVEKADAKRTASMRGPAAALYNKALAHAAENLAKDPSPEVIHWTTRAHFGQTELDYDAWLDIRLEGDLPTLKQHIRDKTVEMQRIGPRYQKLLASSELEWQAAGLCRLADLFHRYGGELRGATCPTSMDADACHSFTEQMAVAAAEMETEARQYYEATRDLLAERDDAPARWSTCWESGLETLGQPVKYDSP